MDTTFTIFPVLSEPKPVIKTFLIKMSGFEEKANVKWNCDIS